MKRLSETTKSTIPYVANYGVLRFAESTLWWSIWKEIPHILHIAELFVPSNLK